MRLVGRTEICAACPNRVHLDRRHVTITRNVEREAAGGVEVYAMEVLSYLHVTCADRMAVAGQQAREAVG